MNSKGVVRMVVLCLTALTMAACGGEEVVDVEETLAKPRAYVGAETCKKCHLEHYDSWKMTLHSRTLQDVRENKDAIIVDFDVKNIQESLANLGDKLKVPADKIYIPTVDEIKYSFGSQWKQNYLVEKDGTLYVAPTQYNADSHDWVSYHEEDWDKRPFLLHCGGCHATGVDLEKNTFHETSVSCEACHGKGSWHAALPKTAVFEKRQTIVNPAKLTMGVAVQICGSCHNRGKATKVEGAGWPVGYEPSKALETYYRSTSYVEGDVKNVYANEFSKGHHQQYIDWTQSSHYREGVTCTSCHYVHQLGMPPTRSQTLSSGSQQCFECHVQTNKAASHAIHSFGNCVGCHMPRIATSAESGDIHSHVFVCLVPKDTLENPAIPNSCQTCHKHKDADLEKLQREAYPPTGPEEEFEEGVFEEGEFEEGEFEEKAEVEE